MIYRYRIGRDNRVASVSDEWVAFAQDNDASELTRERVLGRPLFSFFTGAETEFLYSMLFDEVRSRGRHLSVAFRCDAPALRRSMRLHLSPLEAGAIQLEGRLLWQEPRTQVFLFDGAAQRSDELVSTCGWCKRVLADGEWLEAEEAIERLSLFQLPRLPRLIHGVCPDCSLDVRTAAGGAA